MSKSLTWLVLAAAFVAAALGALMWWKNRKKPATANAEVRPAAGLPPSSSGGLAQLDPTNPNSKYGQKVGDVIGRAIDVVF